MDMLEIGNGAMTELEEQTHFSFWAALKSPLMASTDLASINKTSLDILLNKDMIAISQDDAGIAVDYAPSLSEEGSIQIWAGPLKSGTSKFVILAFNEETTAQDITIKLSDVPRYQPDSQPWQIKDVWANKSLGAASDEITLKGVQSHETKVLLFST